MPRQFIPTHVCAICSAPFHVTPNRYATAKYCSTACYGEAKKNTPERFWSKVDVRAADECWPFMSHRDKDGYGKMCWRDALPRAAHRIAFELYYGTIDPDLEILHSCDNPPCCNPAHLSQGTKADNVRDKVRKGRQARGERNGHVSLTEDQVREIFGLCKRMPQSQVAKKFGVGTTAVNCIVLGKTWRHLGLLDS